ncbi:MAG: MarR family transcriptional regulator [Xanthobacteraceae bacterium]|nr:MAG: MarR family transcriptional regulator [Xanthobacteraceae bacterium]
MAGRKAKLPEAPRPKARGADDLTLDLERYVPALLIFIANKFTHGASSLYRRNFGVGVIEWRCMALLAIEPWISPNRICQVIGLDKAAISRSIRALQKQKLVEVRANSQRSRFLEVALTRKGRELHGRLVRVALEREKRLLADIEPDELEILISALNRMHRRLPEVNAPVELPPPTATLQKTPRRRGGK